MPVRLSQTVLATALCAGALWLSWKGAEFWAFHRDERALAAIVAAGTVLPGDVAGEQALRAVEGWRDTPGLRDRARMSFRAGQRLIDPDAESTLDDSFALVAVDPANAPGWLDLARAAWRDESQRDLSRAAFDMAVLTGPFEYAMMQRRVVFVLDIWDEATEEQRRRLAMDIGLILSRRDLYYQRQWAGLLRSLPAEKRRDVEQVVTQYYPTYKLQ